jgi:hypothetical protein
LEGEAMAVANNVMDEARKPRGAEVLPVRARDWTEQYAVSFANATDKTNLILLSDEDGNVCDEGKSITPTQPEDAPVNDTGRNFEGFTWTEHAYCRSNASSNKYLRRSTAVVIW